MYLERVNPRKSAKWTPPPADEIARIRAEAGLDEGVPPPASSGDSAYEGSKAPEAGNKGVLQHHEHV